jgi:hypothetical protein
MVLRSQTLAAGLSGAEGQTQPEVTPPHAMSPKSTQKTALAVAERGSAWNALAHLMPGGSLMVLRANYRSSFRITSFRPDQMSFTAQTLTST